MWMLSSDVIPFDQIWHHLHSTSARGKPLSNDAQIRVIGRMELEICTKMLKTLSEKLRAKFPTTSPGCSIIKIARRDDPFLEVFYPQASPVEGQSLQQKEKKGRQRKGENKISKIEKPKDEGHFLLKIFISAHARARMS